MNHYRFGIQLLKNGVNTDYLNVSILKYNDSAHIYDSNKNESSNIESNVFKEQDMT